MELKIEYVPLSELEAYENNAKLHTAEQVEQIKKSISKFGVSVNVYAHLKAQKTGEVVELSCAIGDDRIDGRPYSEIVEIARKYIEDVGGFEKFAEWGLI